MLHDGPWATLSAAPAGSRHASKVRAGLTPASPIAPEINTEIDRDLFCALRDTPGVRYASCCHLMLASAAAAAAAAAGASSPRAGGHGEGEEGNHDGSEAPVPGMPSHSALLTSQPSIVARMLELEVGMWCDVGGLPSRGHDAHDGIG